MNKSTDFGTLQRSAKRIWQQANNEIEPLQESAVELIAHSAKRVKRATRRASRFVKKNPWTSAGAVAVLAAAAVAAVIYMRREDRVIDREAI